MSYNVCMDVEGKNASFTILDVVIVVSLMIIAYWSMFFVLLATGGWGPTIGLLVSMIMIGAALYLLSLHRNTGKRTSIVLLSVTWILGIPAVIFGYVPGDFTTPFIVMPKIIVFLIPLLFIFAVFKENVGKYLFKTLTFFAAVATLIASSVFLIYNPIFDVLTEPFGYLFVLFILFLLISGLYPLFRFLMIQRQQKGY